MSKEDMTGLNDTFNTETTEAEVLPKTSKLHLKKGEDVDKDYEYARGNLYSLIDKGQEAVNGALDEVAGQLIKHVGDVADKLMALQKEKKAVKEESASKTVTNNAFFMGSTADLQKMLKQASKKKDK